MKGEHYENWFTEKLWPLLPPMCYGQCAVSQREARLVSRISKLLKRDRLSAKGVGYIKDILWAEHMNLIENAHVDGDRHQRNPQ